MHVLAESIANTEKMVAGQIVYLLVLWEII